jgi:hypothetical protein
MQRVLTLLTIAATIAATTAVMAARSATTVVYAQSDPRVGTWKLNLAKSKYTPGPAPAAETRSYAAKGRAMQVSIDSVDAKGAHVALHYTAGDDGKDYPLTGITFADAIAIRRVDARTFDVDTKKDGKIIGTTRTEISKDGKVLTLLSKTTSPAGQAINNLAIYDKK